MRPIVDLVSKETASGLISTRHGFKLDRNGRLAYHAAIRSSGMIWVGSLDGEMVCMFGLITPSLADNRAYLWLHTTNALHGHEFTFVRQTQIGVRKMLEFFPTICGHCEVGAERSIRWVRWLGATFGEPEGSLIPFQIVRRDD